MPASSPDSKSGSERAQNRNRDFASEEKIAQAAVEAENLKPRETAEAMDYATSTHGGDKENRHELAAIEKRAAERKAAESAAIAELKEAIHDSSTETGQTYDWMHRDEVANDANLISLAMQAGYETFNPQVWEDSQKRLAGVKESLKEIEEDLAEYQSSHKGFFGGVRSLFDSQPGMLKKEKKNLERQITAFQNLADRVQMHRDRFVDTDQEEMLAKTEEVADVAPVAAAETDLDTAETLIPANEVTENLEDDAELSAWLVKDWQPANKAIDSLPEDTKNSWGRIGKAALLLLGLVPNNIMHQGSSADGESLAMNIARTADLPEIKPVIGDNGIELQVGESDNGYTKETLPGHSFHVAGKLEFSYDSADVNNPDAFSKALVDVVSPAVDEASRSYVDLGLTEGSVNAADIIDSISVNVAVTASPEGSADYNKNLNSERVDSANAELTKLLSDKGLDGVRFDINLVNEGEESAHIDEILSGLEQMGVIASIPEDDASKQKLVDQFANQMRDELPLSKRWEAQALYDLYFNDEREASFDIVLTTKDITVELPPALEDNMPEVIASPGVFIPMEDIDITSPIAEQTPVESAAIEEENLAQEAVAKEEEVEVAVEGEVTEASETAPEAEPEKEAVDVVQLEQDVIAAVKARGRDAVYNLIKNTADKQVLKSVVDQLRQTSDKELEEEGIKLTRTNKNKLALLLAEIDREA